MPEAQTCGSGFLPLITLSVSLELASLEKGEELVIGTSVGG